MNRRAFVTGLGALFAAPLAADAQQAGKINRLGFLGLGSSYWKDSALVMAFRQALREEGWTEGRNIVIEYRWANDDARRLRALAVELVDLPVDVIFAAGSNIAALAARDATSSTPIVMEGVSNPVRAGLIAGFAHPGGNVTGLASLNIDLGPKLLELLLQVRPKISSVLILQHLGHPAAGASAKSVERAASQQGVRARTLLYEKLADIESGLGNVQAPTTGIVLLGGPLAQTYARPVAEATVSARLPAISPHRDFPEAGGLMAYGQNKADEFRRAAVYVSKILKGASIADLPVEEADRFELLVNIKTAKALGLTIPPSLLLRAEQVIE
jgi:putative tryptophan/tyrosine transport system substrate-binding protein